MSTHRFTYVHHNSYLCEIHVLAPSQSGCSIISSCHDQLQVDFDILNNLNEKLVETVL